jgi:hypothetical protein
MNLLVLPMIVAGMSIIGVVDLVLKDLLLMIVYVLLKTLNHILPHGILIVTVNHGLAIIQKVQSVHKVLVLLIVCKTVILVQMKLLVMNVLLVSTGMDYIVKKMLVLLLVCQTVILVQILVLVMNVLLVSSIMETGVNKLLVLLLVRLTVLNVVINTHVMFVLTVSPY